MRTWLKLLGSPEHGMAETIVPQVLRLLRFPRRPSIRVGDKIALYVLNQDRVFGIVEAFSPVREGEGDNPWDKWFLDVREVMSLPYADSPSLAGISVGGRQLRESIRQQSHIQLRDLEYRRAVELLLAAGAVEDRLYRAL
jgi:hypothetical protein